MIQSPERLAALAGMAALYAFLLFRLYAPPRHAPHQARSRSADEILGSEQMTDVWIALAIIGLALLFAGSLFLAVAMNQGTERDRPSQHDQTEIRSDEPPADRRTR